MTGPEFVHCVHTTRGTLHSSVQGREHACYIHKSRQAPLMSWRPRRRSLDTHRRGVQSCEPSHIGGRRYTLYRRPHRQRLCHGTSGHARHPQPPHMVWVRCGAGDWQHQTPWSRHQPHRTLNRRHQEAAERPARRWLAPASLQAPEPPSLAAWPGRLGLHLQPHSRGT